MESMALQVGYFDWYLLALQVGYFDWYFAESRLVLKWEEMLFHRNRKIVVDSRWYVQFFFVQCD